MGGKRHGGQKTGGQKARGQKAWGAKGRGAKGRGAKDQGAKDRGAKDRGAKVLSPDKAGLCCIGLPVPYLYGYLTPQLPWHLVMKFSRQLVIASGEFQIPLQWSDFQEFKDYHTVPRS